MSSASASGSVRGWTSSTTNEELDNNPFSFPAVATPLDVSMQAPPLMRGSSPSSNSRPHMHRHSLSLSLPIQPTPSRHYCPSSHPSPTERRAQRKRQDDPNWVPRPPNSFMIFRREFSREHARENRHGEPVAEKHLSKRAGVVWKSLSDAQQRPYKERAIFAQEEHARLYPLYKFKPCRRGSSQKSRRPSGGGLSRREQVESLCESVGVMVDSDSESSPAASQESIRSSSPEYFVSPNRDTPSRTLRRRRSHSLPLRATSTSTYFLQPTDCASTSAVDKRSRSAVTRPPSLRLSSGHFGMPLTPFNDPSIDESVFQFSLLDSTSTAPSSPNTSLFDFSFEESFASTSSVPSPKSFDSQIPPTFPAMDAEFGLESQFVSPIQHISPPSAPRSQTGSAHQPLIVSPDVSHLYHRRQRSNTTSALPPSPLSLVTSSLSNWNGEVAGPSSSTSSLPIITHSASSPDLTTYYPVGVCTDSPYASQRQCQDFGQLPAVSESLLVPGIDMDLDKTPKVSDFPSGIQNTYSLPASGPLSQFDYSDFAMTFAEPDTQAEDLQAYASALEALRITPSPYGTDTPQSLAEHMYNRYINPTPPPM
ncbi:hypothetical protein EUX98_g6272 [Antrodiella citrinella]|uniref:HMG box domain-containing protein n=1 Tax=Antrodiella citrinella TaxID=2447956 RepID=A0A4S4MPE4_9APHY|nr:hypothetical protein EUX98_g6272 [Antrodiella citrinella]